MSFPRFEKAIELLKNTHKHKYMMRLNRALEHVVYGRMTTLRGFVIVGDADISPRACGWRASCAPLRHE